ncbi:MAG: hypothetical protein ACSHYB_16380 [Roseibacillus sp.]
MLFLWRCFFVGILLTIPVSAKTRVWVFCGLAGDEEHRETFEVRMGEIRKSLRDRYGIEGNSVKFYFDGKGGGYAGKSDRETVLAELKVVSEFSKAGDDCWVILMGHATKVKGGMRWNLPGPDLDAGELGDAFRESPRLMLWATMTGSFPLIRTAGGDERIVAVATSPRDPENETDFPVGLVEAFASATDANGDGLIDGGELFITAREETLKIYESLGAVVKELALLDGDGDGRGTSRPARADAEGAARMGLKLKSRFD